MRKKQIAALCMLAALTCQIFLSGKHARAASRYEGYQLCYKENNSNALTIPIKFLTALMSTS